MRRIFRFIGEKLLNKRLDFRVRLFNVLAMAGVLVSLVSMITSVAIGEAMVNAIVYFAASVFAAGLLWYSQKTGKYENCYLITIIFVFLIGFSMFFFVGGTYYGAIPSFFIFAMVFTVFMLERRRAIIILLSELLVYNGLCVYAYLFIEPSSYYTSSKTAMLTTAFGFSVVGITLSITMFLHFRLYNQQQRELEAAREEALSFSHAKSNFLANMSHEIRTPIHVMLGMNEMILRESRSEQIQDYGRKIQNAGKTLLLLINNILDVSKIESGKLTVTEARYLTADLMDELIVVGKEETGRYGLSFAVRTDETLPAALVGDTVYLRQIVVNFLSNAAKYTREGGVTLVFSQKPGHTPDEILLRVSVGDTGIGIREENMALLFDAFTRADMPKNQYIEGTGLGLAIAKELTELMGGQISVESRWGEGSVFTLELPQKVADVTPMGNLDRAAEKTSAAYTGFIAPSGSVLLVDDNEENLQVLRSLLSRTLLRIDTAKSGAECLEKAANRRFDVIVMDYMMPKMDGLETLAGLKALPGFDTPVVALTANVVAEVRQKLLAAGFANDLSKPVMWRDLETAIASLLPKALVTQRTISADDRLSEDVKAQLAGELEGFGIALEGGLHYLSGDIVQYKALAVFFAENYEQGRAEISSLAEVGDVSRMKFCAHSLKSKARAVGANALSSTAAKLEVLCTAGDEAYIAVTLPLLYYEWARARDGLCGLIRRLETLLPKSSPCSVQEISLRELKELVAHNRQPEALVALDRLIARADADKPMLRDIRQRVDELEFAEAERLLTALIGGNTGGE